MAKRSSPASVIARLAITATSSRALTSEAPLSRVQPGLQVMAGSPG